MKALIFHADHFSFAIDESEVNPTGEGPPRELSGVAVEECLAILFHVEEGDGPRQVQQLCRDILKIACKVKATRLMVTAFGHLSHSYAPWSMAQETALQVVEICKGWKTHEVFSTPFGVDGKTLVLHAKSHRDAVKFRSYS